jgi:hypothetical protein
VIKKLTIVISLAVFVFFGAAFTYAQDVPLGIAERVDNFYTTALAVGAIVALGVLVYGGLRYAASAGSPAGQKEARAWILGAILGLFILFASFIILQTINPQLTELEDPTLARQTQPPVRETKAGGVDLFEWLSNFMDDVFSLEDEDVPPDEEGAGTFWCVWKDNPEPFMRGSCEVASTNLCADGFLARPKDCSQITDPEQCGGTILTDNRLQCVRAPTCIDECIDFGISPGICKGGDFPPCPSFRCPIDGNYSYGNSCGAARPGGRSHKGVDISAAKGTPLVATEDGVIDAGRFGWNKFGGWRLWIKGDSGEFYYYAHLSAYAVKGGDRVVAGQTVGFVGSTGCASTRDCPIGTEGRFVSHLHFSFSETVDRCLEALEFIRQVCPQ